MIVIKLGGSLAESGALVSCLNTIEQAYTGGVVIVPGGGAFADQVRMAQRHWRFDDGTAHAMALLAMQQMALLFKGLKPDFSIAGSIAGVQAQLARQKTVIWSPDIVELDEAGVEASWDITSDSLAAWLAGMLSADELILVKSAMIDASLGIDELVEHGIVDKAFCGFIARAPFTVKIINHRSF
jgi:aspartokinase-like uncharacterized kinase